MTHFRAQVLTTILNTQAETRLQGTYGSIYIIRRLTEIFGWGVFKAYDIEYLLSTHPSARVGWGSSSGRSLLTIWVCKLQV
jgi:hypothetical protein